MKRFLFKMYDSEHSFTISIMLIFVSIILGVLLGDYYEVEKGSFEFYSITFVSMFIPVIVFFFAEDFFADLIVEKQNRQIIEREEQFEKDRIKDKPLVDELNRDFSYIADNLKYYIKDGNFILCLVDPQTREENIWRKIELTDDKSAFVTSNGAICFFTNYTISINPINDYFNKKQEVTLSLDLGTMNLKLFTLPSYFTKDFYTNNKDRLQDSIDNMTTRVNRIFLDLNGYKKYQEVQYTPKSETN